VGPIGSEVYRESIIIVRVQNFGSNFFSVEPPTNLLLERHLNSTPGSPQLTSSFLLKVNLLLVLVPNYD